MIVWEIYWIGVIVAFVWYAYDYYTFNVKRGVNPKIIFKDPEEIKNLILISLGSWLAFIFIDRNDE